METLTVDRMSGPPDLKRIPRQSLRNHNERVVLSLVKAAGQLSGVEIARQGGFSAQTASVIARALEAEGLLARGQPTKGKVGKPTSPVRLNPDGAFSFGLRIGRRGADLVLMDFVGAIRGSLRKRYAYPTPRVVHAFVEEGIAELTAGLTPKQRARIVGIGIASPFQLWNWLDEVEAPKDAMTEWESYRFEQNFKSFTDLPVTVFNDSTMACSGELLFGNTRGLRDFAYFYIGSFIGGGLVLNGNVFFGRSGNAAAFGSMSVGPSDKPRHQLINQASIYLLERQLDSGGAPPNALWSDPNAWETYGDTVSRWLDTTAEALASAVVTVAAVVDVQHAVINGGFPDSIKAELVMRLQAAIDRIETQGIAAPQVIAADLGSFAGALGAAFQPIQAQYFSPLRET